ncbi:MAG: hypothetical protein ACRD1N_12035, partial [Terriglobia bacterium]
GLAAATKRHLQSFPRSLSSAQAGERESISLMDPRFRGGDGGPRVPKMFAKKTRIYGIAVQTSAFEVCGLCSRPD